MSGLQGRRVFAVCRDAGIARARPEPYGAVARSAPPHAVAANGVLDLGTIGDLQEILYSLIRVGSVRLIVDVSRVRLCDAAAMSGLVQVSRRCQERGGWLRLVQPVGMVARAFAIVSLGLDVEIYPTVTAALAGAPEDRIMR